MAIIGNIFNNIKDSLFDSKSFNKALEKDNALNLKLYKYYGPTENSFNNLENDIIHLSRPSAFNDPFDCSLGFSVEVVVERLVEQEVMNQLNSKNMNPYQKRIVAHFIGQKIQKKKEATSFIKDKLLNTLLDLKQKFSKTNVVQSQDLLPFSQVISEDKELVEEFENFVSLMGDSEENAIKTVSKDAMTNTVNYQITELVTNHLDSFSQGVDLFKSLYSAKTIFDVIDICAAYGYEDMKAMKEAIENFKAKTQIVLERLKECIDKSFYMVCFSYSYDNVLMWSHYAKKHGGFCVEYDFSKSLNKGQYALLTPVIYSNERPSFSEEVFNVFNENGELVADEKALYKLYLSLLTKSDLWKYEDEWRLIIISNKDDEYPNNNIVDPIISKVYLGAKILPQDEQRVRAIADRKGIEIKQLELDEVEYKLNLKE